MNNYPFGVPNPLWCYGSCFPPALNLTAYNLPPPTVFLPAVTGQWVQLGSPEPVVNFQPSTSAKLCFKQDPAIPQMHSEQEPRSVILIEDQPVSNNQQNNKNSETSKVAEQAIEERVLKQMSQKKMCGIVFQVMTYVSRACRSKRECNKIFASQHVSLRPEWTTKRYYAFMKEIKKGLTEYQNTSTILALCDIRPHLLHQFGDEQQKMYLKVARILANHYLEWRSQLALMTSSKIGKGTKYIHLHSRRLLLVQLKQGHAIAMRKLKPPK